MQEIKVLLLLLLPLYNSAPAVESHVSLYK